MDMLVVGCVTNTVTCVLNAPAIVSLQSTIFDYTVSAFQIIGAVGAAAAAWVAVILAKRKELKEMLSVEPETSNGRAHYEFVGSGVDNTLKRALIWLGIKNVSPSSAIRNCQVYVDSVYHNATGKSSGKRYKLLCQEHARCLMWSQSRTSGECRSLYLPKQIPQFVCIAEIANPPSAPQPSAQQSQEAAPPFNADPLVPQICIKVGSEVGVRIDKNPQDVLVKFYIVGDGLDCKVGYLQLIWKGTRNSDLAEENRHLLEPRVLTEDEAQLEII